MTMPLYSSTYDDSFQVETEDDGHQVCELSITENGYQWSTIRFHSEMQILKTISALNDFLINLHK